MLREARPPAGFDDRGGSSIYFFPLLCSWLVCVRAHRTHPPEMAIANSGFAFFIQLLKC
jgi:hypothetical protein